MPDKNGVRLSDVTDADCGVWIEGASVRNPVEFSVAIIEMARTHGFELDATAWEKDLDIFLNGEPTFDMVEDLGWATDAALEFLNNELPTGFFFDFNDGLCLFQEPDDEE